MKRQKLILIPTFIILFSLAGINMNAQSKPKPPKDAPVFTQVVYQGNDSVYIKNPLGADEFYNPILLKPE